MNLLEIIIEYLEKTEKDKPEYLKHMVEDCGMDPLLIEHIEGIGNKAKPTYVGSYIKINNASTAFQRDDVSLYTLELTR
jgi:hypothetical protein